METYGKVVLYSLSTTLCVDWDELYRVANANKVPDKLIPLPPKSKREKGILEIKEIRRAIQKAVTNYGGITLRENGGAIFIPRQCVENWEQFEKTMQHFKGIEFTHFEMGISKENKRVLLRALKKDITGDLISEALKFGVDGYGYGFELITTEFGRLMQKNKISILQINNMLERFSLLLSKVNLYRDLFGSETEPIKGGLFSVKTSLEEILRIEINERDLVW